MKKLKSLLILILSFFLVMPAYSVELIYRIYDTNKSTLQNSLIDTLNDKNYTVTKNNPYINAVKNSNELDILLLPEGRNTYIYFSSNNSSKSIPKKIVKNYTYDEVSDSNYFTTLKNQLSTLKSGVQKTYSFKEETKENKTPVFKETYKKTPDSLSGFAGRIGKGTKLNIYIQTPINTASALVGDKISGVLTEDWTYQGYVVAEKGSILGGSIISAKSAQAGVRSARVSFGFNKIITPNGKIYDISTNDIDFVVDNDGKALNVVKNAGTGALTGALGGLLFGALAMAMGSDASALWKGALIGAGSAAIINATTSAFDNGVDVEIPAYTEIEIELNKDTDVTLGY